MDPCTNPKPVSCHNCLIDLIGRLITGLSSDMAYYPWNGLLCRLPWHGGGANCSHSRAWLIKAGCQYSFGKQLYLFYLVKVIMVPEMFLPSQAIVSSLTLENRSGGIRGGWLIQPGCKRCLRSGYRIWYFGNFFVTFKIVLELKVAWWILTWPESVCARSQFIFLLITLFMSPEWK